MNNLLNYSIKVDSMEAEHKIYDTYSSFYEDNINIFCDYVELTLQL